MSFNINEAVFDSKGTYLEEKAVRYEEALMDQFAASPEGQAIKERGTELGWAGAMIHYAITYPGVTPPTMTTGDLEEVIYDLFPRKVITERGDGAEIIQELRAFWRFLQRVYQLPQASQMLARLIPQAARRLERELQEPANFGMAKSFVLMGKEAGFIWNRRKACRPGSKLTMLLWHRRWLRARGIGDLRPRRSRVGCPKARGTHSLTTRSAPHLNERRGP
jgi:hypothetical protein